MLSAPLLGFSPAHHLHMGFVYFLSKHDCSANCFVRNIYCIVVAFGWSCGYVEDRARKCDIKESFTVQRELMTRTVG